MKKLTFSRQKLLGNLAFDLFALDMEDRDNAPEIATRRALCEAARAMVQNLAMAVDVLVMQMNPIFIWRPLVAHQSKGNSTDWIFRPNGAALSPRRSAVAARFRPLARWPTRLKGFGDIRLWYR
jgi:hypothetical protein